VVAGGVKSPPTGNGTLSFATSIYNRFYTFHCQ
jgi:hypothetical protein